MCGKTSIFPWLLKTKAVTEMHSKNLLSHHDSKARLSRPCGSEGILVLIKNE